jgi:hypothetical protein
MAVEMWQNATKHFTDLGKLNGCGLVLSSSQFSILPQLPPKIMLDSLLTQK